MTRRPTIPAGIRQRIEVLDRQRCAYCRSPMVVGIPMVVEHIVPLVGGGASTLDKLCLSCYRCNEFKGSRQHAPDALTDQTVDLFHPRRHLWSDHFSWEPDNVTMRGLTSSGRATVILLRLNNPWLVQAHRIWII